MSIPIWFLDVDGVVNAAGVNLPPHLVRTEATTNGITWPIHYSPEVVDFINMVHRGGLAEVRWLTTWGRDARTSLAPAVGLDEFFAYDMRDSVGWWKAEIVAASIATERRPVIWTDDDLTQTETETETAAFRSSSEPETLLVAPLMDVGLTAADLRQIHFFTSAFANAAPLPSVLLQAVTRTRSLHDDRT